MSSFQSNPEDDYPYRDLRAFLGVLEAQGQLKRVASEVDPHLEIGAIMRKICDSQGPAILFEKIKGYPEGYRFFSGTFLDYQKFALALGLSKDAPFSSITRAYREGIKSLIKPVVVKKEDAPCKENIHQGDEIDLYEFPTPFWHHRDGGPYLGTLHCVIMKDPDSDWINVGMYRLMIHDKSHLGIMMLTGKHGELIYKKNEARTKPTPVAISIGQDPVNAIVSFGGYDAGISEWDVAGGLRQRAVELVPCQTNELEVPATAEIVIEGVMPPYERREEGPFGEYPGYYGGLRAPRPVIEVTCISHRNDPVNVGLLEGKPVQENNVMIAIEHSASLEKLLMEDLRLGVKAVYAHPWAAAHGVIVSMKPQYPGHTHRVANAIWASGAGRSQDYVIVVEDDIDPTNLNEVLWCVCTRCKPDRDIIILPRTRASGLWPCLTPEERLAGIGAKVLIDATFPAEWPKEWVPAVSDWEDYPEEVKKKVTSRWREYGLG